MTIDFCKTKESLTGAFTVFYRSTNGATPEEAKKALFESIDTRKNLEEWYNEFKKPQLSASGDMMARFFIIEFEKRFPFLCEKK